MANHFIKHPDMVKRDSFETSVLLTNVASVEANSRYVGNIVVPLRIVFLIFSPSTQRRI